MLKSIHIRNFRSCRDVKLEGIESLLVLMGRNGAGKSNILKAIVWVAKRLSNRDDSKSEDRFSSQNNGEVDVQFVINDHLYEYQVNYSDRFERFDAEGNEKHQIIYIEKLSRNDNGVFTTLLSRDGEFIQVPALADKTFEVSNNISAVSAMQSLLPEDNHFRQLLDLVSKFFFNITYYPLELNEPKFRAALITQEQYQNWLHNKKHQLEPAQVLLAKILHLYLANKDKYEELLSLIGDDGLGIIRNIEIHDIEFPSAPGDDTSQKVTRLYFLAFSPAGHKKDARFEIGDLSFGTKRVLSFMVALLFDSASVALIEQIEDGIHEGLVDKLIPLIRDYSDGAQFILASHSTAVFNRLQPEEVRVVELDTGTTTARALSKLEIDSAIAYMQNDGPFSDFLQSL